jgi:hypothetical protein
LPTIESTGEQAMIQNRAEESFKPVPYQYYYLASVNCRLAAAIDHLASAGFGQYALVQY